MQNLDQNACWFDILPNEILLDICSYLDFNQMLNYRQTCKRYNSIFYVDSSLWRPEATLKFQNGYKDAEIAIEVDIDTPKKKSFVMDCNSTRARIRRHKLPLPLAEAYDVHEPKHLHQLNDRSSTPFTSAVLRRFPTHQTDSLEDAVQFQLECLSDLSWHIEITSLNWSREKLEMLTKKILENCSRIHKVTLYIISCRAIFEFIEESYRRGCRHYDIVGSSIGISWVFDSCVRRFGILASSPSIHIDENTLLQFLQKWKACEISVDHLACGIKVNDLRNSDVLEQNSQEITETDGRQRFLITRSNGEQRLDITMDTRNCWLEAKFLKQ